MSDASLMLEFLLPPFAMCVVLAGIHVYMGMHVLRREVIFVDLALAQMAALGTTVAETYFHHGESAAEHGHVHVGLDETTLISFAFAALGAVIFALTGRAKKHVSQEAIVGIVYAVSAAAMMLILSKSVDSGEDLKKVFGGVLLLTEWKDVEHSFYAYVGVGILLYLCREQFHRLTWQPDEADTTLTRPALWNFFFYLLFAVVLTVSIRSAGVLLVFSFLIVPAVITKFFWSSLATRLFAGWALAMIASIMGLGLSWVGDYPAGSSIILAFGALLAVTALFRSQLPSGD